ncbi:hypothetical protein IQ06DRAFT_336602 [Phaeosphaeriaceae sp. SRC1lsM3a]|nr:hypothetical protein IQ06DRAFT_336602 [Stagonospora sp. SRC1lsM3a]
MPVFGLPRSTQTKRCKKLDETRTSGTCDDLIIPAGGHDHCSKHACAFLDCKSIKSPHSLYCSRLTIKTLARRPIAIFSFTRTNTPTLCQDTAPPTNAANANVWPAEQRVSARDTAVLSTTATKCAIQIAHTAIITSVVPDLVRGWRSCRADTVGSTGTVVVALTLLPN